MSSSKVEKKSGTIRISCQSSSTLSTRTTRSKSIHHDGTMKECSAIQPRNVIGEVTEKNVILCDILRNIRRLLMSKTVCSFIAIKLRASKNKYKYVDSSCNKTIIRKKHIGILDETRGVTTLSPGVFVQWYILRESHSVYPGKDSHKHEH